MVPGCACRGSVCPTIFRISSMACGPSMTIATTGPSCKKFLFQSLIMCPYALWSVNGNFFPSFS